MLETVKIAAIYVYQFVTFILFSVLVMPIVILFRNKNRAWVISGHRGRIYDDNSGALHQYILNENKQNNTNQKIIWISTNPKITAQFKSQNIETLSRNSFCARLAIILAPVLIYSHGEDDLDLFLILWRKVLGKRIYLNHCLNHIKAGDCNRNDYLNSSRLKKVFSRFLMTDYDHFLASSEVEKHKFGLQQPHNVHKNTLGGGAHIDYFIKNKNTPTRDFITYFPTHRDSAFGKQMLKEIINQIISDPEITKYLKEEKLIFNFCMHINSGNLNIKPLPKCFAIIETSEIKETLAKTKLLITDYSSLQLDYLIFEKPLILFPFDLEDYTNKRNFFQPYECLNFSKAHKTFDSFKAHLISNNWKDISSFAEERKAWMDILFPYKEPVYAKKTYQKILELI